MSKLSEDVSQKKERRRKKEKNGSLYCTATQNISGVNNGEKDQHSWQKIMKGKNMPKCKALA